MCSVVSLANQLELQHDSILTKIQSIASYIRCSNAYCSAGPSILTWHRGARVSDVSLTEDSHKAV